MKPAVILIAVLIGAVAAYVGYTYMNTERPLSDRLESTIDAAGQGNLGEAADEAGNTTYGDKLNDDLKDAVDSVTPTPAAQ